MYTVGVYIIRRGDDGHNCVNVNPAKFYNNLSIFPKKEYLAIVTLAADSYWTYFKQYYLLQTKYTFFCF